MNPSLPNRDPRLWHPLLLKRWPLLAGHLLARVGKVMVNEGYRSDLRQGWLWAQGRTAEQCRAVGIDPAYARSGPVVTNAWSAKLSAHGWCLDDGSPAACALDLVPLGKDDKPWSPDDPWGEFVALVAEFAGRTGLRHFSKPGKPPWDKPHVQLVEWSDGLHRLVL